MIALVLLLAVSVPSQIEDHAVNSHHRLPARVASWPAPDAAAARASSYDRSPWLRSLNGRWKFRWSPDPASRPAEFHRPDFDVSSWAEIPVPSTWERQGYGVPLFVNSIYPFHVDPPRVMGAPPPAFTTFKQRNPVGAYRRTFEVPRDWAGRRVVLHFAGVSSAFFVWINGRQVGYSEDSRLPAEFDVTPYLRPGANDLAVEVYKYCDGSYLEDQDFWRLAGIFRDVLLRAVPQVTLWDVYAQPSLDADSSRGRVTLHLSPANFTTRPAAGLGVRLVLLDPAGRRRASARAALPPIQPGFGAEQSLLSVEAGAVEAWSDERPAVYTAIVELQEGNRVLEAHALPVGFRRLELAGGGLALNGRPMKVRGVNRHEMDPDQGYTVPPARNEQDVRLMKQANLNFVRNAHYPMDPRWYTLTSAWGLMVLDEANVESHGLSYHKRVLPGDDPVWTAAVVERMRRMVIRDRQFPSVVMWSLGNEAGWGQAFLAMRAAARDADPEKRLIQYADMNRAADLDSQTYPTPDWLREHLAGRATRKGERGEQARVEQHGPYPSGRPFLMNEYAHSMGNSVGNLREYWDLIEAHPMLVGGFIWDWADQALWRQLPDGRRGLANAGDFGEQPTDFHAGCDGLVDPDRRVHPHYHEVAKVHQPVAFRSASPASGTIELSSRQLVRNLADYRLEYELAHDGRVIRRAVQPGPDVPAGATRTVRLWARPFDVPATGETFLTVRLRLARAERWAAAGHVVAWEQFALTPAPARELSPLTSPVSPLALREDDATITVEGPGAVARFDRSTGLLASLRVGGRDEIVGGLRFNFWRALTDNDRGWKVGQKMAAWRTAGRDAVAERCTATRVEDGVAVESVIPVPATGARAHVRQVVRAGGVVDVHVRVEMPASPEAPRLGLQCALPATLKEVEWFGRGPHENYRDRRESAAVGLYHSTVNAWLTPYVRPQENANRTDVRRVRFTAGDGHGLLISAPAAAPLSVSAWPYRLEDLEASSHDEELPRRDRITVNLDHLQMGVGGDNSWGLEVHPPYRITPGRTYVWSFRLEAASPGQAPRPPKNSRVR
jgi:beta-galactosidase